MFYRHVDDRGWVSKKLGKLLTTSCLTHASEIRFPDDDSVVMVKVVVKVSRRIQLLFKYLRSTWFRLWCSTVDFPWRPNRCRGNGAFVLFTLPGTNIRPRCDKMLSTSSGLDRTRPTSIDQRWPIMIVVRSRCLKIFPRKNSVNNLFLKIKCDSPKPPRINIVHRSESRLSTSPEWRRNPPPPSCWWHHSSLP